MINVDHQGTMIVVLQVKLSTHHINISPDITSGQAF